MGEQEVDAEVRTAYAGRRSAAAGGAWRTLTANPTAGHEDFRITGLDGIDRDISATVFPLFAHVDELSGAVAIFWDF